MKHPVKANATLEKSALGLERRFPDTHQGTPRLLQILKILGALPSQAIPYKVPRVRIQPLSLDLRVALFQSAQSCKTDSNHSHVLIRVGRRKCEEENATVSVSDLGANKVTYAALMTDGSPLIPAAWMAT